MLISVHVPKTAGTTLLHHLKTQFTVFLDLEFLTTIPELYTRWPHNPGRVAGNWMHTSLLQAIGNRSNLIKKMEGYDCIHGHFHVVKYRFLPNAKFITFVREPLERMVSHYYFWKQVYEMGNPTKDIYIDDLFKRNTSLNEFLFEENLKNYQCRFIKGMHLSRYSFIGVADEEYFADDIDYLFNKILKCPLEKVAVERLNKTAYNKSVSNVDIGAFRNFHKNDYELYEYALQNRK